MAEGPCSLPPLALLSRLRRRDTHVMPTESNRGKEGVNLYDWLQLLMHRSCTIMRNLRFTQQPESLSPLPSLSSVHCVLPFFFLPMWDLFWELEATVYPRERDNRGPYLRSGPAQARKISMGWNSAPHYVDKELPLPSKAQLSSPIIQPLTFFPPSSQLTSTLSPPSL
jgi:hypothetical protein